MSSSTNYYNISDDKIIHLRKEYSILKTSQQANEIIQESIDGKKTARREFLDAWESLNKEQKNEKEMKQIQKEYKKIITNITSIQSNTRILRKC